MRSHTAKKCMCVELRSNPVGLHSDLSPPYFPCWVQRGALVGGTIIYFFGAGYQVLGLLGVGGNPPPAFWAFRRCPSLTVYFAGHLPHPPSPRAQPAGQGIGETQPSVGWRKALPGSPENPRSLHAGTEAQLCSPQPCHSLCV